MSDVRQDGEKPDVLQTAVRYRDHLKVELAEVEEFLLMADDMADDLSRASEHMGPVCWQFDDGVAPRRLH